MARLIFVGKPTNNEQGSETEEVSGGKNQQDSHASRVSRTYWLAGTLVSTPGSLVPSVSCSSLREHTILEDSFIATVVLSQLQQASKQAKDSPKPSESDWLTCKDCRQSLWVFFLCTSEE
jgi:hypothetical protein